MLRQLTLATLCLALSLPAFAADAARTGDISKVNGSIRIEADTRNGDVSTVNGSVRIGARAEVGRVSTVNGSVELADGVHAASIDTVNGRGTLGRDVQVAGAVGTVNGAIELGDGSAVGATLSTVNGGIRIGAAQVVGQIRTVGGDVEIGAGARAEGGLLIDRPRGLFNSSRKPRVVIGPNAEVRGTLEFRREVDLYVSNSAKIGTIVGATPVKFDGARPAD